jgi:hypothetical protein
LNKACSAALPSPAPDAPDDSPCGAADAAPDAPVSVPPVVPIALIGTTYTATVAMASTKVSAFASCVEKEPRFFPIFIFKSPVLQTIAKSAFMPQQHKSQHNAGCALGSFLIIEEYQRKALPTNNDIYIIRRVFAKVNSIF